jgi:hypothetical protein
LTILRCRSIFSADVGGQTREVYVRTIRTNVRHKAGELFTLNGCAVQRCVYCGELLWDSNMRGGGFSPGNHVDVLAPASSIDVGEVTFHYEPRLALQPCYEGVADKRGRFLEAAELRVGRCPSCREGQTPKLLDDDGVVQGVSGQPATWAHANTDGWWPCKGVR